MAKATATFGVTLHLNEDEAIALRDVLSHVSGFTGTRRDYINNIIDALEEIGVEFDDNMTDISGDVEFV